MRSYITALSDSIHASAEELVNALDCAADSLGRDDLTEALATAISHRGQIDAIINGIMGSLNDVADEERHQRRYLDIAEVSNGGYVLTGYLDPKSGALVKRALDAVIQREDTEGGDPARQFPRGRLPPGPSRPRSQSRRPP